MRKMTRVNKSDRVNHTWLISININQVIYPADKSTNPDTDNLYHENASIE
jgi:hypothetical protein